MSKLLLWTVLLALASFNGAVQGAPVPGEDFYRGLMRIWLGDDPVDAGMKKALLGGMTG